VIPTTLFSTYGIQIGSAIEMVLLAFALADRYHVIRLEKEHAQREALKAQQSLVENLQMSERILEIRVTERTDELKRLNQRLAALSETDSLTGLANRRRFDDVLTTEWRRAQRLGQPLAVGLLDVDWFKAYNDHYGHLAGDDCLKRIATVLGDTVSRTSDLAARYGGEEFAFIAPGIDGEQALKLANRVCEALAASGLPHAGSSFGHVTASVGVACIASSDVSTPQELVQAADEALYRAKAAGRNQAVMHSPQ
jgi:diguanylate cyclase (GGDEF)-like protein